MSESEIARSVSGHYGWSGLMGAIEDEIRLKGIDPHEVTVAQLAPVDNYHWLRLAGTLALADAAAIAPNERVLDVGGGIGGPARQLASRFGCHVTVLDVTPEYCLVGEKLTDWTRLADRVAFVHGSALDMPFPDGSFDVVWTQHATMNIPDKPRLYGEIARPCGQAVGSPCSTSSPDPINPSTSRCRGRASSPSASSSRQRRPAT